MDAKILANTVKDKLDNGEIFTKFECEGDSDPYKCKKETLERLAQINTLFDIKSKDDGTWRRIRVCDFHSKFTENPYEDFPKENYPYQFKIDKKLTEKFNEWAPIFASMLIDLAFKTEGRVKVVRVEFREHGKNSAIYEN